MALGIPTVCSPVGVNSEIIRDGENGFLATKEDEWVMKLQQLLRSAELRRNLGMTGRATVEADYSAKIYAPRVLNILESIVKGSGVRRRGGNENSETAPPEKGNINHARKPVFHQD
jgi:glycosyltransferase involved in cell wall biosynthesis